MFKPYFCSVASSTGTCSSISVSLFILIYDYTTIAQGLVANFLFFNIFFILIYDILLKYNHILMWKNDEKKEILIQAIVLSYINVKKNDEKKRNIATSNRIIIY